MSQLLFSFGTRRQAEVQPTSFGHRVPSTPEAIVRYRPGRLHRPDRRRRGRGAGALSDEEPAAAHRDAEVSLRRIEVRTVAGLQALAPAPEEGLELVDRRRPAPRMCR